MKRYLHDFVFAEFDNGHIILTTESDGVVTNSIYINPQTMLELNNFASEVIKMLEGFSLNKPNRVI